MSIRIAVIMAGGSGERFWPLSRKHRPKQLLKLTESDESLLRQAVSRIEPLIPPDRIFIVTAAPLQETIRRSDAGVPATNVLAEPCKRNTAGCLVYAAAQMMARFENDGAGVTMAVLTADHLISNAARFRATVETAMEAAEGERALGVIGVIPTRAETGYGYIEIPEGAERLPYGQGDQRVYPVRGFREKPGRQTAEEFIATERFFWNSGMFFWTLPVFLDELDHASPPHARAARELAEAMKRNEEKKVNHIFEALPDISIDYALMEKARRVVMARAAFGWDDVGAWDSLDRTRPRDADGNVAIGDPVLIDTKDCIIYNEPGADEMAVVAIGVENLAIIVSSDGVLVVPKHRAQDVRQAVSKLKESKAAQV